MTGAGASRGAQGTVEQEGDPRSVVCDRRVQVTLQAWHPGVPLTGRSG